MIVTHVEKGSQITMKDGSYKSIEDILPAMKCKHTLWVKILILLIYQTTNKHKV